MLGSCALHMCLVAAGCADAHFSQGISVWDIAAGYLMVQEAGGVIVDTGGRNCVGSCCACALSGLHCIALCSLTTASFRVWLLEFELLML